MATPTSLPATFVAGNVLTAAQMNDLRGAFRVLQFVNATVTTNQATSSTTFIDLTDSDITITPSSADSNIFLLFTQQVSASTNATTYFQFMRDGVAIFESIAAGSTTVLNNTRSASFYDSPATTSAITYKVQIRIGTGTLTSQNFSFSVLELSA